MTATTRPLAERQRRGFLLRRLGVGGLAPALLFAFAPKCFACLLAYAGLGAALGFGGPEICGVTSDSAGVWRHWLPLAAVAMPVAAFALRFRRPAVQRIEVGK